MFECMNCHELKLVWQCDYDFDALGIEGKGIVSYYECSNCGAQIELRVPTDIEENEE